ncbi:MAG: spore maturation protein [Bacilli bacterium]|nr:spore maturation protein [Bacilli bacterium]
MITISNIILPLITLIVIIYALYKKVNIYEEFLEGVKEGLKISLDIFPSIFAIIISVTVLVKSDLLNDLISLININLFPKEILPIAILRPISSSSSMMILNDILLTHGADSLIGKISSIIAGSTDTTIYIIAMYYSSIKIKKIKQSLLIGLLADLSCVIISIIIVKIL